MLQFGFSTGTVSDTALNELDNTENTSGKDTSSAILCPTCGTQTLRRTSRKGFMQRVIYPRFGYYPWECSRCNVAQLIKNRGARHRRRKSSE